MKKNQIVMIAVLAVVAIGLCVLYFLLKDNSKLTEPEKAKFLTVASIDSSKVNRVQLQNGTFNGVFVKENGGWVREEEGVFPVKQAAVDNIVSVIGGNLRAFSKIDKPADLGEYGLDNPAAVLKLYDGDVLLVELSVGRKHPTQQDRYFMKIAGDDSVYIVSDNYNRYLVLKREDFLEDIKLPYISDKTLLREIYITGQDVQPLHAIYDENNPYDYSSTKSFRWYFTEPFQTHVNADLGSDTWEGVIDRYRTVSYEKLVAFRPSDYARYGLSEPSATVYVRYAASVGTSEQDYTLHIGSKTDDGYYYARVKGIDWVFLMKEDTVNNLLKTDVSAWYYKTVFFPGINEFEKMTVKTPKDTWVFVGKTGSEDETVYVLNGHDLADEDREAWVRQFLLLKYRGISKEEITGKEVLSIEIIAKNPQTHANMTLTFYEKDESVYLVTIDGKTEFTIDVRDVNDFIDFMESFR